MSRFISRATHRFDLGQGEHGQEHVDLRDELSAWERDQMYDGITEARFDPATSEASRILKVGTYNFAILGAYITGWQLFDSEGQLVPYTKEALHLLDGDTVGLLTQHVDSYQKESAEGKKTAAGSTGPTAILELQSTSGGRGAKSLKPRPA